ncbi:hypothetical protein LBMAG53_21580 [Planctomycetota bacterium]|nr:hypothetical protein LBMAG53_21580 [Planctomycetota bacterium]
MSATVPRKRPALTALTVRRLPLTTAKRLKARAKANHHSLEAEVRAILIQEADRMPIDAWQKRNGCDRGFRRGSRACPPLLIWCGWDATRSVRHKQINAPVIAKEKARPAGVTCRPMPCADRIAADARQRCADHAAVAVETPFPGQD